MSKNTNLSFLTDYITADITNGRIGINNASPAYAFDVTGIARTSTSTYLATASGSVGIGTTSPTSYITGVLSVVATGDNYVNIVSPSANAAGVMFQDTTGGSIVGGIRYTHSDDVLSFWNAGSEKMRITSAGNVGIGNTNPNSLLTLKNSATNTRLELDTESAGSSILSYDRTASAYKILYLRGSDIQINPNDVTAMTIKAGGNILIGTTTSNNHKLEIVSGSTSAIRVSVDSGTSGISMSPGAIFQIDKAGVGGGAFQITSGGNVLINQSVTDASAGGAVFQLTQGNANWIHFIKNSNTSGNVYGSNILFSYAPNNTASAFFGGSDSSTERYRMYANGGLANYATNNVVLSDERLKKDITPLESVWNKIKNIEIVKYKFKDQTHDDFNMGVIAQQVEKIAPELIEIDGWGTLAEDGSTYKGIYETDINYYSIKALQEAMAKIEILESEITILKNK